MLVGFTLMLARARRVNDVSQKKSLLSVSAVCKLTSDNSDQFCTRTFSWCFSGGGKSTVASLLERFYDCSSGGVYLDGINIKEFDPKWLRGKCIGYIR